ncbi:MAG: protein-glutamate O-methyltransferase CheR [Phenylobacterium sp.]|uniref:CheR family methyltransferase n=1 Tax=Phenylobacterium sp. TaxID=1871053 RepID=UPI00271FB482|nr:protein-glutamate O-methyltransferase CheR [Phenylobacterium sp.]MDO8901086.1 protein-glutamate O-methyltransferase CheR [Phenylobacterium sp.]MDP2215457.1 protein-glutamate O-methyltransferase CheR [Phenylobacterium sp.]
MKPEDRELVAQLCAARSGQKVDPAKDYLIETRLGAVARREGFDSIGDLMTGLRAQREDRLIWAIVEAMAAGDTSFFRDRTPFDHFREVQAPELARRRGEQPIRIWSAACSTGQEVHSLAMLVDDMAGQWPDARFELFGSDLSERALEKAQSGLYTQFEVQRGLPIRSLVRHFEKVDDMWVISPQLRQSIRWRRLNLIGDLSRVRGFDLIFCRNVIGGMIEPARQRLVENLAAALNPGGQVVFGVDEDPVAGAEPLRQVEGAPGLFALSATDRAAA